MSPNRAFRVVATGARVATGAVIAAACVVGVVAAVHAPWPEVSAQPAQVDVVPVPGDSRLVCNGDLRALGRSSADPLSMVSAASPRFTMAGSEGDPEVAGLATIDVADAGELRLLVGAVDGRTAPLIAAAESVDVAAEDLDGFAALPCAQPRLESWLVGGSVATGTEDLVILTNAADVNSTVTLLVYGDPRGSRTVVVPARSQTALPLSSIAAGNLAPVVKVTADGAPVRAVLQSSLTRTLDPAGIDLQDAVAGAQQHQVFPGIRVAAAAGDADMTVIRMLAPETDGEATVTVRSADDDAVASRFTVPLMAGMPAAVSPEGLTAGTYSVTVDADVAVVAAVRQQDGFGAGSDFTWTTPSPGIDAEALLAVPAGPEPTLHVANPSDEAVTVAVEDVDGRASQQVEVPAATSVTIPLEARTAYRLTTTATVHASVSMTDVGAMASWPVQPSAGAAQSIRVYP